VYGYVEGTPAQVKKFEADAAAAKALEAARLAHGIVFVEKPQNIRTTCNSNAVKRDLTVPTNIPSGATAVFATISHYNSDRNDHVNYSFGRDNNHDSYTWDNRIYDLNTRLNDIMVTENGDSAAKDHYGYSHGSQIVPITNGKIKFQGCQGHSRGTHYITLQVYGYVAGPKGMVFVAAPKNVRTTCKKNADKKELDMPVNIPSGSKAVLGSVSHFNSDRNDHVVYSFGRDNSHSHYTWDNQIYTKNSRFNDVLITENGDSGGSDHYGYSHGSEVLPLTSSNKLKFQGCMGHSRGTHYVTTQAFGYVPATSPIKFVSAPKNLRTTCNGSGQKSTWSVADAGIPGHARAVFASITTFSDGRNDHVTHSFGRFNGHQTHTWDNAIYDANTYLNDVIITHNGDSGGDAHYGYSHGTQILPVKDGKIYLNKCMGHSRGTHYITAEVYGYVEAPTVL
jgi:hypothetical protein